MGVFPVHKSVAGGVVGSICGWWWWWWGGANAAHGKCGSRCLQRVAAVGIYYVAFGLLGYGLVLLLGYLLCLHPKYRRSLFLLKLGSFQFAVLKIVFTILSIVLYTNGLFDLSDVSRVTSNIVSFLLLDLFGILL